MFFLIGLFFSTFIGAQTVEDLCGNTNPNSMLTTPLAKISKFKWCFGGVCEENSITFERNKCVKQIRDSKDDPKENEFMVSFDEVHSKPGSVSYKSYGAFYRLYPGDSCFDECRPVSKQFMGMTTGKKLGVDKEECTKCMLKLPVKEAESFVVEGHGVTVYKGQKCYALCRLPAGPFLDHRPYSSECLTCIGAMGIKPMVEHLVNKAGECFELREGNYRGVSKVPEHICENIKAYETYYTLSSKYTLDSLIFGKPQLCLEVDNKTGGKYYQKLANMSHCDPDYVDNSDRGNTKTQSSSSGSNSSKKSVGGAIKN